MSEVSHLCLLLSTSHRLHLFYHSPIYKFPLRRMIFGKWQKFLPNNQNLYYTFSFWAQSYTKFPMRLSIYMCSADLFSDREMLVEVMGNTPRPDTKDIQNYSLSPFLLPAGSNSNVRSPLRGQWQRIPETLSIWSCMCSLRRTAP